jgi:hypothetical protein
LNSTEPTTDSSRQYFRIPCAVHGMAVPATVADTFK